MIQRRVTVGATALALALATTLWTSVPAVGQVPAWQAGRATQENALSYELMGHGPRLQVLQDSVLAMAVPAGAPFVRSQAALILHHNEPVQPGSGGLLLRGWTDTAATAAPPVAIELERGGRDTRIADRTAVHWVLRSTVRRSARPDPWLSWLYPDSAAADREFVLEADLWTLTGVPFSWITFGPGPDALPRAFPGLRTSLEPRLDSLGLVARAEIRLTPTDDDPGAPEWTAFEIRDLRPAEPIDLPDPIVDRVLAEAVDRLIRMRPRSVCSAAREGDLPGVVESRVAYELRGPVLGLVRARCRDSRG